MWKTGNMSPPKLKGLEEIRQETHARTHAGTHAHTINATNRQRSRPECTNSCQVQRQNKDIFKRGTGHLSGTRERRQAHTHTRCGHANTRQTPCGWHDEALGVDVKTPCQVMKNNILWPGAFLPGTVTQTHTQTHRSHTHTHLLYTIQHHTNSECTLGALLTPTRVRPSHPSPMASTLV